MISTNFFVRFAYIIAAIPTKKKKKNESSVNVIHVPILSNHHLIHSSDFYRFQEAHDYDPNCSYHTLGIVSPENLDFLAGFLIKNI